MSLTGKKKTMDMTEGVIWKQLVAFALPLLIGNLFQQLYNTVDSIVVGNFVSTQALAAVGSVTPIINMLIGFFSGLATGAGVVISQYFGAHNGSMVHKSVHTTILMTIVLGVIFTFVGIGLAPVMLRFMSTPDDVMGSSSEYLRIYFGGVIGLMLYNIASGILRAVGDSKRPLYFLIVSSVVNVVLDLVFVIVFKMGVAGVAWATILAQFISAGLALYSLARSDGDYRFVIRDLRMDWMVLKKVVRIGLPAGLQMAITSFSNVFVQSYINAFGSSCMAGWTSYSKIDQFVLLPMQSLSLSATTFVGQNLGAGKLARAKKRHPCFARTVDGDYSGTHHFTADLLAADAAAVHPGRQCAVLWRHLYPVPLPVLRPLLRQPDLCRFAARCGRRDRTDVHYAGKFRVLPSAVSVCRYPVH